MTKVYDPEIDKFVILLVSNAGFARGRTLAEAKSIYRSILPASPCFGWVLGISVGYYALVVAAPWKSLHA